MQSLELQEPDTTSPWQSLEFTRESAEPETLPRKVLDWIPYLWNQVLFPGTAPQPGPLQFRPVCLLILLAGALLYPCLSFELFEPDEGRYAQIPREMLESGEWILPTLQGEPYLDKPPLFYWLVMCAYSLFGYHAWAARLIPALAVHAGILATYLLGRRLLGERSAWWGSLLLLVSPAYLGMGRLLLLDGLLTMWVTLAILSVYLAQRDRSLNRRWWLFGAICCGLGVLTKGPVALILVLGPLLCQRMLSNRKAPISRSSWAVFLAISLGLAAPWYLALCWKLPDFARYFFWQHNVMRFVQPFDHIRPVWFYVPILLAGMLPVMLLIARWGWFLNTDDDSARIRRAPEMGYLLLAGGWCVLFFSLAGSKLPTYILPAFAPLCLAAGHGIAHSVSDYRRYPKFILLGSGTLLVGLHFAFVPWYARSISPMNRPELIASTCLDPVTPVVCYPRHLDSVAFSVGRSDFKSYRTKQLGELLDLLDQHPRVTILFSHRHSSQDVISRLPPHLRVTQRSPLGPCDMAVVERIQPASAPR